MIEFFSLTQLFNTTRGCGAAALGVIDYWAFLTVSQRQGLIRVTRLG